MAGPSETEWQTVALGMLESAGAVRTSTQLAGWLRPAVATERPRGLEQYAHDKRKEQHGGNGKDRTNHVQSGCRSSWLNLSSTGKAAAPWGVGRRAQRQQLPECQFRRRRAKLSRATARLGGRSRVLVPRTAVPGILTPRAMTREIVGRQRCCQTSADSTAAHQLQSQQSGPRSVQEEQTRGALLPTRQS